MSAVRGAFFGALLAISLAGTAQAETEDPLADEREAEQELFACLKGKHKFEDRAACIRIPYESCQSKHPTGTIGMGHCLVVAKSTWKKRLTSAADQIDACLSSERRQTFRELQARWTDWVPANCELFAGPPAGSLWGLEIASCTFLWTAQRALELEVNAEEMANHPGCSPSQTPKAP